MTRIFKIFEFKTKAFVEMAADFEAGFKRCMELYRLSGKRQSFYVKEEQ